MLGSEAPFSVGDPGPRKVTSERDFHRRAETGYGKRHRERKCSGRGQIAGQEWRMKSPHHGKPEFRPRYLLVTLLSIAAQGSASAQSGQSNAPGQGWPARPLRVVVPFTAASATDIIARLAVERLSSSSAKTSSWKIVRGRAALSASASLPKRSRTVIRYLCTRRRSP